MCFNAKKKRYTYLSMCSYCNVVSKYSSTVKNHLLTQHKRRPVRVPETQVIPIRIENKFEKIIGRTLDKTKSKGNLSLKISEAGDSVCVKKSSRDVSSKYSGKRKVRNTGLTKTQTCSFCHTEVKDHIDYLHHLSTEHTDKMFRINFTCSQCKASFLSYFDIKNHFEKDHSEAVSYLPFISCMSVKINKREPLLNDQLHCSYCKLLFAELQELHYHVRGAHSEYIKTITVAGENKENDSRALPDVDLLMYSCQSCGKRFHTLLDLNEHVIVECPPSVANSKPTRKRRPPKWLESEETVVKKLKTSSRNVSSPLKQRERECPGKKANLKSMEITVSAKKSDKVFTNQEKISAECLETSTHNEVSERQTENILYSDVDFIKTEMENETVGAISDSVEQVNIDAEKDKYFDGGDYESEVDIGDSDDDFVPEQSDNDSDENMKIASGKLECIFCDKSFSTSGYLHAHMKRKHSMDLKDVTGFNLKTDKRQVQKKSKNVLTKKSENAEDFVTKYKCPFCELNLYHKEYMKSHVQQSHPEVTKFRIHKNESVMLSPCEEDSEFFKCPNPICDVVCIRKSALQDHMSECAKGKYKSEKILCNLPKTWMEKVEKSVHLICPHCDTVVVAKDSFEDHLREHFPGKMFEVQLSNTLPPPHLQKSTDQKLKKTVLKEIECSMCPFCELVTTQKAQLSKHFKRFHSNETVSSVICCVLSNQSSLKATAQLIIKDRESTDISEAKVQSDIKSENDSGVISVETGEAKTKILIDRDADSDAKLFDENMVQTVYIQSKIPVRTYLCPICDFQTLKKKDIKLHMDEHNSKAEEDIDSIYLISDKWIRKEDDGQFKCQFCDSLHSDLTLGFRHVRECHRDCTMNETNLDTDQLYELVTVDISGVKEKYEKQKYRCTTCSPGFTFKSKKGLQLHLKTLHKDRDSMAVYESVYQMMDLLVDTCDTRVVYKCSRCGNCVLSKSELIDHVKVNHPEQLNKLADNFTSSGGGGNNGLECEETKCGVCGKEFMDFKSLKHHLILHMNRFKPTCDLCELCFTNRAELECHNMDVHFRSGEMCYKCGAMFPNLSTLEKHVNTHETTPKGVKRTLCQHCGATVMARNMKKHLVDRHIEQISCECNICEKQEIPDGKTGMTCDICSGVCCTWYNLRGHRYKEHNLGKKNKTYKCKHCKISFQSRKDHVIHTHKCRKLSEQAQTFEGLHWGESFRGSNSGMMEITKTEEATVNFNHGLAFIKQKYIHVEKDAEKAFMCKLCPSSFSKMTSACNHLRRMHTRDETKRLRCKVCKMGFMDKKDFESHCRTHIGLRQYQCSVCQKRYKTLSHLKEHKQIHMSDIYNYPCGYCGLEFNQRGALLGHVVHHDKLKPFNCPFCDKGYTTHGDLQRHMLSYSKQSKFSGARKLTFCGYCSKDFPNHNALVKHFQIHQPATPFECVVCVEKFSSFRQMYNHKSKKSHFSESDVTEGKMDLQAPGRKFRQYQVSKRKIEIGKRDNSSKENEGIHFIHENLEKVDVSNESNTVIETVSGAAIGTDESAEVVVEEFESDVIRSMLDADPEVFDTLDFNSTHVGAIREKQHREYKDESVLEDDYKYEIPEHSDYQTDTGIVQDFYEVGSSDYLNTEQSLQNGSESENIVELGSAVAETVKEEHTLPGTTHSFQTSDGTIIQVCVIKHER